MSLKLRHLGGQRFHLLRQYRDVSEQRTDQIIFLGNAEAVKIGQFIHALAYRLPLPFLKLGVAMLFRPT